jgi:hypothetical protein
VLCEPQRAPRLGDVARLQEVATTIQEGYRLFAPSGKMNKADWSILKREHDMGEFGWAIDKIFLGCDLIDKETFFLVVAKWAGLFEDLDLDPPRPPGIDHMMHQGQNKESRRSVDTDLVGSDSWADKEDLATRTHINTGSGPTRAGAAAPATAKAGWLKRIYRNSHLMQIKRRLRGTRIDMDVVEFNFKRLDPEGGGYVDRDYAELLLGWTFSVDLNRDEWEILTDQVIDPTTGVASYASIAALCHELGARRGGKLAGEARPRTATTLVFKEDGAFISYWRKLMSLTACFYFATLPYIFAFLRDDLLTQYVGILWASWGMDSLMLLDVLVKLNTSYTDPLRSVEVTDRAKIRERYLVSECLIDIVGLLPLDIMARYLGAAGPIVASLRFPKFVFCYRLHYFFKRTSLSSLGRRAADLEMLLFVAVGLLHLLACVWFYMTYGVRGNYLEISDYHGGWAFPANDGCCAVIFDDPTPPLVSQGMETTPMCRYVGRRFEWVRSVGRGRGL